MGTLFVGRQLLAESRMKKHPLTPMQDSNLMRLLEPQVTRPVGLVDRLTVAEGASAVRSELAALQKLDVAHVVVDAVANDDLTTIADACRDMPLMTGGSAIATPLSALLGFDDASSMTARPDLGAGARHRFMFTAWEQMMS